MTLKIEKNSDRQKNNHPVDWPHTIGAYRGVEGINEGSGARIALDLEAVTLVDVDTVRFLNACEESGIKLLNCCPYIREWMVREKDQG